MLLTMVATSSSTYAAGSPVFHMSYVVHNWRGDIAVAEQDAIEELLVEEVPEPTEELPVDDEVLEPTEEEASVGESVTVPEADVEISPVDIEELTPAPTGEDITEEEIITEEQIENQITEGEENIDQNKDTLEPEG